MSAKYDPSIIYIHGGPGARFDVGETFTIEGVYHNTARRWWQFWKPKYVQPSLQLFKVVGDAS